MSDVVTLPAVRLDRGSSVPAYAQLGEVLAGEIRAGRWRPGDRLPAIGELCAHYDVAPGTVRQALNGLEADGLIQRERGRGTFVANEKTPSWLLQSSGGFHEQEAQGQGLAVTSRVLRIERGPLPGWAAEQLRLQPGTVGVTVERLRSVDGRVALHVVNYLPDDLAEAVLAADLERDSLYACIRSHAGVMIQEGQRSIAAVIANEQRGELLECPPGTPLVFIESVSRAPDGRPVDAYRAWLRTDRVRIEIAVGNVIPATRPRAAE